MSTQILTPVGRMVQGHPMKANTTDQEGQPLLKKDKVTPRSEFFCAIAIPKNDPGWAALWQQMTAQAAVDFPAGQSQVAGFSWKVIDGDSPGYIERDGFAGCWILRMVTGFPPPVYAPGATAKLTSETQLKRGDFIRAYVEIQGNSSTQSPGVYVNLQMVEFVCYGDEIVGGPDGAQIFGAAPVAELPAGGSATPLAPTTPLAAPVGAPPQVAPMAAPVGAPPQVAPMVPAVAAPVGAPPIAGAPMVPAPVAPNPGILTPGVAPVAAASGAVVPGAPMVPGTLPPQ